MRFCLNSATGVHANQAVAEVAEVNSGEALLEAVVWLVASPDVCHGRAQRHSETPSSTLLPSVGGSSLAFVIYQHFVTLFARLPSRPLPPLSSAPCLLQIASTVLGIIIAILFVIFSIILRQQRQAAKVRHDAETAAAAAAAAATATASGQHYVMAVGPDGQPIPAPPGMVMMAVPGPGGVAVPTMVMVPPQQQHQQAAHGMQGGTAGAAVMPGPGMAAPAHVAAAAAAAVPGAAGAAEDPTSAGSSLPRNNSLLVGTLEKQFTAGMEGIRCASSSAEILSILGKLRNVLVTHRSELQHSFLRDTLVADLQAMAQEGKKKSGEVWSSEVASECNALIREAKLACSTLGRM